MMPILSPQELARRFNEDEAVWRRYQQKRRLRRTLGVRVPLPEEILDYLAWREAERECREKRYIGGKSP
jgi:hypothetical protein